MVIEQTTDDKTLRSVCDSGHFVVRVPPARTVVPVEGSLADRGGLNHDWSTGEALWDPLATVPPTQQGNRHGPRVDPELTVQYAWQAADDRDEQEAHPLTGLDARIRDRTA